MNDDEEKFNDVGDVPKDGETSKERRNVESVIAKLEGGKTIHTKCL